MSECVDNYILKYKNITCLISYKLLLDVQRNYKCIDFTKGICFLSVNTFWATKNALIFKNGDCLENQIKSSSLYCRLYSVVCRESKVKNSLK
jgi:hypothetical protein